ncbi:uncharacterized protein LOC134683913 [Mytilus trossulus]|uniref:uncharacterized protein LOC134683913 n=1 Tax=Mytilus trossulus TaxID=6551 RepID=UPI0030072E9D
MFQFVLTLALLIGKIESTSLSKFSSDDNRNESVQTKTGNDIYAACETSFDCNRKLICTDFKCQCCKELYWNGTNCLTRKGQRQYCNSSLECIESLLCVENSCICAEEDYWDGHKCVARKLLNSRCSLHFECQPTLSCARGYCQCPSSDYWNGSSCALRKIQNETCRLIRECGDTLQCKNNTCVCCEDNYWNGTFCITKKQIYSQCSSSIECAFDMYCCHGFCQISSCFNDTGMGKRLNKSCSSTRECKETLTCENRYCQCSRTEHWNGIKCDGNSKGVQFTIVFTEKSHTQETKLLLASKIDGLLSQYTFFDNRNKTTRFTNTQYSLDLPIDKIIINKGIEKVGMEVQSSVPISLYGIQDYDDGHTTEAYMVIPRKYLSKNYLLPSFKVYSSSADSALTIITTEDSTTVTINLQMENGPLLYKNVEYNNHDVISLVLNRFHSFKLSHSSDLSGTTIQATKPISVLTSSIHNQITGNDNLNELLEMVLPLNQIDRVYVIPEIVTRPTSTVRVYCPKETTLIIYDGSNRLTKHVDDRDFIDFTHHKISYINGNHDFLVMIIPTTFQKVQVLFS